PAYRHQAHQEVCHRQRQRGQSRHDRRRPRDGLAHRYRPRGRRRVDGSLRDHNAQHREGRSGMKEPVWTTEKVATLKKLVSNGLTDREIAERLQAVSECAVKNKRYKLGFTSDRTVWTPEEDELLRQMWADGHKAWVIGNRLDRTASSVKRRREKLNLEPRARGASGMRPEIAREESNEKVFAFLQECVNQNKRVPPLKEMAAAVGLSDTTTRRALRRLSHAGRIKLVGRTHQSVVEIDGKRSLDPRHDDRPLETRFVEFVEGLADRGVAYPGHKQAAVRLFVPRDELVKVIRHL